MQPIRVHHLGQEEGETFARPRLGQGPSHQTKVIIADVQDLTRAGMRSLLNSIHDVNLIGEATDGDEAMRLINEQRPDIAILDLSIPGLSALEVTRLVKAHYPEVKVLIVTIQEDADLVSEFARSGASGYILKNADSIEIIRAIRTVSATTRFFSPTLPEPKIDDLINKAAQRHQRREKSMLTPREREVLYHIAEGLTSRQIAEKLSLSLNTINTHRMNIMKKLDLHNTAALVRYALQHELTDPQS